MTAPAQTSRDSRPSVEQLAQYQRAVTLAAERQKQAKEVTEAAAAGVSTVPAEVLRRLDGISGSLQSLTARVDRLEKPTRKATTGTAASDTSDGDDTSVSNSSTATATNNGNISSRPESWPWPWAPPPPPVLTHQQGPDFINADGNAWIDSTAFLTGSGQLQVTTHVQAQNLFVGCTTGTVVILTDAGGDIIAKSELQQIGVDGTWIPFKESNRTVQWSQQFTADVAARARGMYVWHFHAGRNRILEQINEFFQLFVTIAEAIAKFCENNPDLCEDVAKAFSEEN